MRVRLTPQAAADLRAAAAWWRENREKAPGLFVSELRYAKRLLSAAPRVGVAVHDEEIPGLRRLSLSRIRYVLFYRVDQVARQVIVLRIWHSSRGQRPRP